MLAGASAGLQFVSHTLKNIQRVFGTTGEHEQETWNAGGVFFYNLDPSCKAETELSEAKAQR